MSRLTLTRQANPYGLLPGEWAVDNSAHVYKQGTRRVVGYGWEAVNLAGDYVQRVAHTYDVAEERAKGFAGCT